ncbi:hypothetical protein Naga_100604g2 [Nannochloropsis gaditana]|uniref:Uncharacterized protein n=1 Tax=Nannochloropsis gaditana TaxID=72520 RepID=W7T7P9_9STRA|nr:hypothetical protein Naga_100604g2 [Nannochloropsis gaditana]EWM23026.1 hypothetical protein Naga_100604g2 [Nannochloropsis gaditana]
MQFHRELLSGTQERGGPRGEKGVNPKEVSLTALPRTWWGCWGDGMEKRRTLPRPYRRRRSRPQPRPNMALAKQPMAARMHSPPLDSVEDSLVMSFARGTMLDSDKQWHGALLLSRCLSGSSIVAARNRPEERIFLGVER